MDDERAQRQFVATNTRSTHKYIIYRRRILNHPTRANVASKSHRAPRYRICKIRARVALNTHYTVQENRLSLVAAAMSVPRRANFYRQGVVVARVTVVTRLAIVGQYVRNVAAVHVSHMFKRRFRFFFCFLNIHRIHHTRTSARVPFPCVE